MLGCLNRIGQLKLTRNRTGVSGGISNFALPIPSSQIPYDGFAVTPLTEPVSPSDCARWPNSPNCGGSMFDICGIPPSFWVETKCKPDGVCCTYSFSTFLGYSPPPVITCYRLYGKPPEPSPIAPLPDLPDIPNIPDGCRLSVGFVVGLQYHPDFDIEAKSFSVDIPMQETLIELQPHAFRDYPLVQDSQSIQISRYHYESDQFKYVFFCGLGGYITSEDLKASGLTAAQVIRVFQKHMYTLPILFETFQHEIVSLIGAPWKVYSLTVTCPNGSANYPIQPADYPPPQPPGELPMPCCEESSELLREILKRLGNPSAYAIPQSIAGKLIKTPTITEISYELPRLIAERMGTGQFPVEIPKTLLSDDDKSAAIKLESLTEFVGWFVQQVDALVGQFPIKIEVEDVDAIKEGDQKKEISLPNLAEAIAELYGLSFQSTYNSTLIVDLVLRNISEAIKNGNMGVETLDYSKAVAKHLGFKGNKVERKIPYFVDPRETQDLDKYRKEVELVTQGFEYEDKQTMGEQMKMILFAVSIIKASFWEDYSPKRKYEAGKEIRKDAEGEDKAWDAHLAALRLTESPLRQDDDPPLKIREIPKPKKK